MGRPKKAQGQAKTSRLSMKVTPARLAWLHGLREMAGDKDVTAMIDRLTEKEARRLKYEPPPGVDPAELTRPSPRPKSPPPARGKGKGKG